MTQPVWDYLQGLNSLGGDVGIALGAMSGGSTPSSAVWPVANDALYVPFTVKQGVMIKRLYVVNGTAVSGNIDAGIYTQGGARIVSAGSTVQAGTSAPQFFDVADFMLGPGRYYFAVALDNITGTVLRANHSVARLKALGMAKQASAFALPASATFATVTDLFLPLMGAEIGEVR